MKGAVATILAKYQNENSEMVLNVCNDKKNQNQPVTNATIKSFILEELLKYSKMYAFVSDLIIW